MRDALHACSHRARVLPHLSMCSVTKTEKQLAMSTNELTSLELDGRSAFFSLEHRYQTGWYRQRLRIASSNHQDNQGRNNRAIGHAVIDGKFESSRLALMPLLRIEIKFYTYKIQILMLL